MKGLLLVYFASIICSFAFGKTPQVVHPLSMKPNICTVLGYSGAIFALTSQVPAKAAVYAPKLTLPATFLSDRVRSSDGQTYRPGYTADDVFYPKSFEGTWQTYSVLIRVEAPLGKEIFGGVRAKKNADEDMGRPLIYLSKFRPSLSREGSTIADRLYNVEKIVGASMGGENVIVDDKQSEPDLARNLNLAVSPAGSNGGVFDIHLVTTDREFKQVTPTVFECFERTSQEIRPRASRSQDSQVDPLPPSAVLRKDIETVTVYQEQKPGLIIARQRTATYLSADDSRYKNALALNPAVANTAIDIREYLVTYERRR